MLTLIAQKRHDECHIGCVLTVLSRFVNVIDYKEVSNQIKGNSLYDMRRLFELYDIKATSYKIDKKDIENIEFKTMICQIKDVLSTHFVVIEKENDKLYYYNPSSTCRKRLRKYIIRKMSGFCLIIESPLLFSRPTITLQIHYSTKLMIYTFLFVILLILLISI